VDNDKKNFCSVKNSKNKGAFLKSLNQCFMWITKRRVWKTIKFSTKIFFQIRKTAFLFNVENHCGNCGKPSIKNVYKEVFSRTLHPAFKPFSPFFI
jgi:7-cyano-7-deazaguanine synthase in queuosine biosynthesis